MSFFGHLSLYSSVAKWANEWAMNLNKSLEFLINTNGTDSPWELKKCYWLSLPMPSNRYILSALEAFPVIDKHSERYIQFYNSHFIWIKFNYILKYQSFTFSGGQQRVPVFYGAPWIWQLNTSISSRPSHFFFHSLSIKTNSISIHITHTRRSFSKKMKAYETH